MEQGQCIFVQCGKGPTRAAYKPVEIQNRYHIIRETDNVVDPAAPGSWLQVIRGITREQHGSISPIVPIRGHYLTGTLRTGRSVPRHGIFRVVNVVTRRGTKTLRQKSYDQARPSPFARTPPPLPAKF